MVSWTPELYERVLSQDILPLVSKPNRYVGNELGLAGKVWDDAEVRFVLCYPDVYEVGMSHAGTQILYHIVNRDPRWLLDRVYAPWPDMEEKLREHGIPLWGLEHRHPVREYDILGFTLQAELTYTNLLNVLDLSGVPLRSEDRGEGDPIVMVGGPCVANPEPLAPFYDCALVGDAEEALGEVLEVAGEWKRRRNGGTAERRNGGTAERRNDELLRVRAPGSVFGAASAAGSAMGEGQWGGSREALLAELATCVPGIYVPAFYEVREGGRTPRPKATAPAGTPFPVIACKVTALRPEDHPRKMIVSLTETTHDRFPVEVMRGCVRGCRFCQAGYIYRPARERDVQAVIDIVEEGIRHSGWREVSALSLSTADYSEVEQLADLLSRKLVDSGVSVALPSLRADEFSVGLAEAVSRVRKSGFTFAPEAGSQRLRNVINKGFTESEILGAVDRAMRSGWMGIKLYFMIGHPTETEDDIDELVALVKKIGAVVRAHGGRRRVTVAISPFVPKAHTPFQWERQDAVEKTRRKLRRLKQDLKGYGIEVRHHDVAATAIEGVLSRGGREAADIIEGAFWRGARLDGWSEHRKLDAWQDALRERGLTFEEAFRERAETEDLPWDVVSWRVGRGYLLDERANAYRGETTAECKHEQCSLCGVCEMDGLQTILARPAPAQAETRRGGVLRNVPFTTVRLRYTRGARVRFLSHLDLLRELERTLRRAGVPVLHTEGFAARPRLSAGPPLALGWTSDCEWVDVELEGQWPEEKLSDLLVGLNAHVTSGVVFVEAAAMPGGCGSLAAAIARAGYIARFPHPPFDTTLGSLATAGAEFLSQESVVICRPGKRRRRDIDIRPLVLEFAVLSGDRVVLRIATADGHSVKPTVVLGAALGIENDRLPLIRVHKFEATFASGDRPTAGALARTGVTEFETRDIDFSHQPARDARGDYGGRPPK